MLVGIDPEVFVRHKATNSIVPVMGLLGGTKHAPRQVSMGGSVQEDNVMAEFNIEPADNFRDFNTRIDTALKDLDLILGESGHEYDKSLTTSYRFSKDELSHPQALVSGCDPDFNIHSNRKNQTIDLRMLDGYRMCAGHIHCGTDRPDRTPNTRRLLVHWMDLLVGAPLSIIDPDSFRRNYYGKAGNFRPKPYGVEYRTPSNFWLSSVELRKWVFDQTIDAINRADSESHPERIDSMFGIPRIASIINSGIDVSTVHYIMQQTTGKIPAMFKPKAVKK